MLLFTFLVFSVAKELQKQHSVILLSIKLVLFQEFEHSQYRVWMEENWQLVCRWASTVYLLMIFGGQYLMKERFVSNPQSILMIKDCTSRPPFQLRTPLIVWNLLLSIFSIFGAARTIPEFIFTFSTHGIYHSLCVPR